MQLKVLYYLLTALQTVPFVESPFCTAYSTAGMLLWLMHNHVQIMSNMSVVCHMMYREGSVINFDRFEITFLLNFLSLAETITRVPQERPDDKL